MTHCTFKDMPIRFFIFKILDDGEWDQVEVQENEFIAYDGVINYERHTIAENGVRQICLNKTPF